MRNVVFLQFFFIILCGLRRKRNIQRRWRVNHLKYTEKMEDRSLEIYGESGGWNICQDKKNR